MRAALNVSSDHAAVAAVAEHLRGVTAFLAYAFSLRDVREFRQRLQNLRTSTVDIRAFTEQLEGGLWERLAPAERHVLYDMALRATSDADGVTQRRPDRSSWVQALLMRVSRYPIKHAVSDAEDAVFWFADTVFDKAEDDAPAFQAMFTERLAEVERGSTVPGDRRVLVR